MVSWSNHHHGSMDRLCPGWGAVRRFDSDGNEERSLMCNNVTRKAAESQDEARNEAKHAEHISLHRKCKKL